MIGSMSRGDKSLVWLHGEIKTPPLSSRGRLLAGLYLRRLQHGEMLAMPQSRPMPAIGARCHELRIPDDERSWRIFYRIDDDAIVILGVEPKTTSKTPKKTIDSCKRRLASYDQLCRG